MNRYCFTVCLLYSIMPRTFDISQIQEHKLEYIQHILTKYQNNITNSLKYISKKHYLHLFVFLPLPSSSLDLDE